MCCVVAVVVVLAASRCLVVCVDEPPQPAIAIAATITIKVARFIGPPGRLRTFTPVGEL